MRALRGETRVIKGREDHLIWSFPFEGNEKKRKGAGWRNGLLDLNDRFRDFSPLLSINIADLGMRDKLIPIEKMSLEWLADYSKAFFRSKSRKSILNFVLSDCIPLKPEAAARMFDPDVFTVKLTPLNQNDNLRANDLESVAETSAWDPRR